MPSSGNAEDTDLVFRAQLGDRRAYPALAAAVVVLVAVVAIGLWPGNDGEGETGIVALSAATESSSPAAAPTSKPGPIRRELEPGWAPVRIGLTVPADWWSTDFGTTVYKEDADPGRRNAPTLTVHRVARIATDICDPTEGLVEVGPTVEDLTTALVNQAGPQRAGPTDVMLGGYPAKRFVLTIPGSCPVPEGYWIWANAIGAFGFRILDGGTGTIYVVDVNGDRLVITSQYGARTPAQDVAELDAIIASIDIEPFPTIVPLSIGRHSLTVDGVSLSFSLSTAAQDGWAMFGNVSINKSVQGPQEAEGIIYWTSFPDGTRADPCANLLNPSVGPSAADLAAAVATAPGTALVTAPVDVVVGGRPAKYVVVSIREDLGCDPGFFFTWQAAMGGPLWMTTDAGDTIRVWIVDVDGARLFIAGETHRDSGSPAYEAFGPELELEIEQIVDSIQFE